MRLTSNFFVIITFIYLAGCNNSKNASIDYQYKPDDEKLYDTIVHLDSLFFHYYNTCDVNLEKHAAFYSDSIEFYHDQGGLYTSKTEIVEGTRKNICGKVTRELVKGSIEVYSIKGYGAIEVGLHKFHNNQEKDAIPHASRFIVIWQYKMGEWKIARVVSLH